MNHIKSFFKSLPRGKTDDELMSIITAEPVVRAWLLGMALQCASSIKTHPRRMTGGRPAFDEEQFMELVRALAPDREHSKSKSELARAVVAFRKMALSTAHSILNRLRDRGLIAVEPKPGDMFEVRVYCRQTDLA